MKRPPVNAFQAACLALCGALSLHAQAPQPVPSPANAPGTLHVYVNRMQIPVLLLDFYRHPAKPVPADRFQVNLQGVPTVRPTRVRLQGDDPLSIVLLIDHSSPAEDWWDRLPQAAAALAASLHPDDRVEVYGMDGCNLRRYGQDAPISANQLVAAVTNAAAAKPSVADKRTGPCPQPVSLWESLTYAATMLQQRGGRRILLALTNGQRDGSNAQMNSLRQFLNMGGIALFAVEHGEGTVTASLNQHILQRRDVSPDDPYAYAAASIVWGGASLALESELSGGLVLTSSTHALPHNLQHIVELVRGRYIVEFPRPANLTAGAHILTVSIGKTHDFIRPSGMSLPVASTEELAVDPSVLHGRAGEPPPPGPAGNATPAPAAGIPAATSAPPTAPASAAVPASAPVPPAAAIPAATPAPKPAPDPLDITDEVQQASRLIHKTPRSPVK